MGHLCRIFNSSIGKKFLVGAAGLLLCGFVFVHLAENMLLFVGPHAYNTYATTLESNPLLPLAEIILAGIFLIHIIVSLYLRWQNKQARPVAYAQEHAKGGRTPGSRTMTWTALLVLFFLVVHIRMFRFGPHDEQGLFHLVTTWLSDPRYGVFYVVALLGLLLHLSHGVQSMFQTFGLNHPRYMPLVKSLGWAFAIIVCAGFAAIPITAMLGGFR